MTSDPWATTPDPWASPCETPKSPEPREPEGTDIPGLLTLLNKQKDVLVGVARHDVSFKDKEADDAYRARGRKIRKGLNLHGLNDPFPYRDLRDWWNFCSTNHGHYWEREQHLDQEIHPLIDALEEKQDTGIADWAKETPENWAVLELRVAELKAEFEGATTLDDYQDVGRRSVEIIMGAVKLVWDPSMVAAGESPPKGDDAKAKFDILLSASAPGKSHEELRSLLRAAWRLGHDTKHSGHADRLSAFCSAQAAVLIARSLQEMQAQQERHASDF